MNKGEIQSKEADHESMSEDTIEASKKKFVIIRDDNTSIDDHCDVAL